MTTLHSPAVPEGTGAAFLLLLGERALDVAVGGDGQSSFRVLDANHSFHFGWLETDWSQPILSRMESETCETNDLAAQSKLFAALSHPKRLRIFDLLMEGVHCNCEIAEKLGFAPNLVSHHLRILEETGLVRSERDAEDARWIYFRVDVAALRQLQGALARFLDEARIQPRIINCGPVSTRPHHHP